MNHRPFEDWLLEDRPLTSQQERELQGHLRSCTSCSAIAESNLALHTVSRISPPDGFTQRFSLRLASWRKQQGWHQLAGTLVLVMGGLALLYAIGGAAIQQILQAPADWITATAMYVVFLIGCLQVLQDVGGILLRALPVFIPPAGWLVLVVGGTALAALWALSMRRLARAPRGV
jgi:hypothetical protein